MIAFNWFLIFFPCVFDYFYSRFNYVLKRISYLIELWLISILRRLKFKSFLVVWIVVIFLFFSLLCHNGFCFSFALLFYFVFLLSMFLTSYLFAFKMAYPNVAKSSRKLVSTHLSLCISLLLWLLYLGWVTLQEFSVQKKSTQWQTVRPNPYGTNNLRRYLNHSLVRPTDLYQTSTIHQKLFPSPV